MILLNWKANGSKQLIEEFKTINVSENVVVMPPHCLLGSNFGNLTIGGQVVSEFENGAHTGEVTAEMLKGLNVKFCLAGHSERRMEKGETNEILAKQLANLTKHGITPVLCVGESLQERKNGNYFDVLTNQLAVFQNGCVVAYEPVWAIGTGLIPKMEEIVEMKNFIKKICGNAKVLYGGSVSSANLEEILATGVDGVLVGGASLKIDEVRQMNEIFNK